MNEEPRPFARTLMAGVAISLTVLLLVGFGYYAGLRQYALAQILAPGVLLLGAAPLLALRWRQQTTDGLLQKLSASRGSQMQLTAVLESISDGFNSFDREWRYTYVNAAAGDAEPEARGTPGADTLGNVAQGGGAAFWRAISPRGDGECSRAFRIILSGPAERLV